MTRIYMAGFGTEINTFSPIPSDLALFEEVGVFRGNGSLNWQSSGSENYIAPILEVWRRQAERLGCPLTEGLCACAQPAGVIPKPTYEKLRDDLLEGIAASEGIDILLLCLHGAMVADGYDDCEGDLLQRARQIVGENVVIGVHLDLHVNLTNTMLGNADILISHKEYPHVDGAVRAEEVFDLCLAYCKGDLQPVTRTFELNMVGLFPTTIEPMRSFVETLSVAETGDVISISLGHGFPWSDIPDAGARLWVTTDNNTELAEQLASELGRNFYSLRTELLPQLSSVNAALDYLATTTYSSPVVIADVSDNSGGGAPSDSTFILEEILERGLSDIALGAFWDPACLADCAAGGEGKKLKLSLGGKHGEVSGSPVDIEGTVRAIKSNHAQLTYEGLACPLGTSVWFETDTGVHLVLTSIRSQVYSPELFTGLGLDLAPLKAVVVKSSQHFYAKFRDIASEMIYVPSQGTMPMDFANIPYQNRDLHYWPRVADPLNE